MLSSDKKNEIELFKLLKNKKILLSDLVKTIMQPRDSMPGTVIRKVLFFYFFKLKCFSKLMG